MKRKVHKPALIKAIEDVDSQINSLTSPSVVSIEIGHAIKPLVERKAELVRAAHIVWGTIQGDDNKQRS